MIQILLNLGQLSPLLPYFVQQRCEFGAVRDLAEGVGYLCQEAVEIEFPILVLVLDSVLQNALIVVACHEDLSVFEDVDRLDHGGEGIEGLADGHLSLRNLVLAVL